jgi:hypothetical protein
VAACLTSMPNVAAWVTVPLALVAGWAGLTLWPASSRLRLWATSAAITVGCLLIYVLVPAWVAGSRKWETQFWSRQFRPEDRQVSGIAEAWKLVRDDLPPGSVIAYANTFHVYPLYGFDYTQFPVYAPTRPGVHRLSDLPRFPAPTTGEQIPANIVAVTAAEPDRDTWLANLRAAGAQYLLVGKRDLAHPDRKADVPELRFAAADPARFQVMLDNEDAALFRIAGESSPGRP